MVITPTDNWLYENDLENTVRYVLGTNGKRPLICFGINPSTAEPNKLDNTLKSVNRQATAKGFDSWIMLNLYPQRATNPSDIHENFNRSIHDKNLKFIEQIFSNNTSATVWAAWGTLIETRPFLAKCLADIYSISLKHNCHWVRIGDQSNAGHPHHPLYLATNKKVNKFDINKYLKKFSA